MPHTYIHATDNFDFAGDYGNTSTPLCQVLCTDILELTVQSLPQFTPAAFKWSVAHSQSTGSQLTATDTAALRSPHALPPHTHTARREKEPNGQTNKVGSANTALPTCQGLSFPETLST